MTDKVLFSWIGETDLRASISNGALDTLLSATLSDFSFDRVILFCSYPESRSAPYVKWLKGQTVDVIEHPQETLVSPVGFESISNVVDKHLNALNSDISILLSPGIPAIKVIWILLDKTKYSARFYQPNKEQEIQEVKIPFETSTEYIPPASNLTMTRLKKLTKDDVSFNSAFKNIITQTPVMQRLKYQTEILAKREVPVLIQGETRAGKELF